MATVEVIGTPPQILRGSSVTLSAQFYADGVPADPGVTTVAVVDLAGNVEVPALTATGGLTTAPRTVTLSAGVTADLDTLTVTWATENLGTVTTEHEVIGAFLFTIAEARAHDGGALANPTTYPTAEIEAARARILDEFETICGVSFVPRYRYETVNGSGLSTLSLPQPFVTAIRSVESRASGAATWTAYTVGELADVYTESWGEISRETLGSFTTGRRNYRVGYEHGYERPPHDVKLAALMVLRDQLVDKNFSDRAISISSEFGTSQLWTAGISARGSALYSLPEVHRILSNHMHQRIVVA